MLLLLDQSLELLDRLRLLPEVRGPEAQGHRFGEAGLPVLWISLQGSVEGPVGQSGVEASHRTGGLLGAAEVGRAERQLRFGIVRVGLRDRLEVIEKLLVAALGDESGPQFRPGNLISVREKIRDLLG